MVYYVNNLKLDKPKFNEIAHILAWKPLMHCWDYGVKCGLGCLLLLIECCESTSLESSQRDDTATALFLQRAHSVTQLGECDVASRCPLRGAETCPLVEAEET